jgi:hypothetical protein
MRTTCETRTDEKRKVSNFPGERVSNLLISFNYGGRGGIRTHGTLAGTPVFKTGALNHSATLPIQEFQSLSPAYRRTQWKRGEFGPSWRQGPCQTHSFIFGSVRRGDDRCAPQSVTLLPGAIALRPAVHISVAAGNCAVRTARRIVLLRKVLWRRGSQTARQRKQAQ